MTSYRKVTTETGETIFVRTRDFNKFRNALKNQESSKKIISKAMTMMVNCPEGITQLAKGTFVVSQIYQMEKETLKSLRDLIDYKIKNFERKNDKKKT